LSCCSSRGRGGQRADRRVGRRRVARLNLRQGGSELVRELVVELVDHDEALRRVARLTRVLQAPADSRLHHRVEVVGLEHDERVRPAELQDDLLEVPPGDLRHGGARAPRPGERDALDARVGDDAGDLLVRRVDVDVRVGGDTRGMEDVLHRSRRLRALRRVLEEDRVADHQVRARKARDLIVGVVPWHDPEQQADRATADDRRAVALQQLDRLVLEQVGRVVGVVLVDRRGEVDLATGLLDRLAHLADNDLRQPLTALRVQLGDAADHCRALLDGRSPPPGLVGLVGAADGRLQGVVRDRVVLLERLARRRVDDRVVGHCSPLVGGCEKRA
jgi:hypothetical protein